MVHFSNDGYTLLNVKIVHKIRSLKSILRKAYLMCAPKTALFGPFRPLLSDCVWKNGRTTNSHHGYQGNDYGLPFVLCLIPAILHEPVLGSSAYAPFETVEKESKTGERLAKLVRQSARFGWNSLFFLYVPHMWASRAFGKKELVPSSSPVMPFYGQREMIRLPRNDWKKNLVVSF